MPRRHVARAAHRAAPLTEYAPSVALRIERVRLNRCRSNLFWVAERDAATLSSGARLP